MLGLAGVPYPGAMTNVAHIRPATESDVPAILGLVRELAAYEREPDAVVATEEALREALFGADPKVWALIVEHEGRDAGFVLWFLNFSTWEGKHGVYIEDLFVRAEFRGLGYGRALLVELAQLCVANGYARLEWAVLDWNSPAHGFYRTIGAGPLDDWTAWRLDGAALATLGGTAQPATPTVT